MALFLIILGMIVLLLIVIAVAAFLIAVYNKLIRSRNRVRNSFAQIDTQLQRRFDLIPNLVETVKGYAEHEMDLLESITASRSGYMQANTGAEKLEMDNQLTSTLKTLFAVSENYPELKANTNFIRLQEELAETEEKVAYARQFYNDAVTLYNDSLQTFPNNIVGRMFGFNEEELFRASVNAQEPPKVQF